MNDWTSSDILKLTELLQPSNKDETETVSYKFTQTKLSDNKPIKNNPIPSTLEEYEKQAEMESDIAIMDSRKQPEYQIKYCQAVTSEDIYLQMGPKTPSSASCEDMIITIKLEKEKFSAIDLDVAKDCVKINSFLYKLNLCLPHSVNPDKSNAKWDQSKEELTLTLRMCREFDYINF